MTGIRHGAYSLDWEFGKIMVILYKGLCKRLSWIRNRPESHSLSGAGPDIDNLPKYLISDQPDPHNGALSVTAVLADRV